MKSKYVFYLAVVPIYRKSCLEAVRSSTGKDVTFFAGRSHLDKTVTTGISERHVVQVQNRALLGNRLLLQTGHLRDAICAEVCVVDLNPRSLTAWMLAVVRRLLGKRTLAWGHLYPRAGADSRTAPIRVLLRRLTAGTILYGYDSVVPARVDLPEKPLWVAPNSLYHAGVLRARAAKRSRILYVGRLERSKNVQLLIDAFIASALFEQGMTLDIVGFGAEEEGLRRSASDSVAREHIRIHGRIDDVDALEDLYAEALFSVSPGYVGLSMTQSFGFGVPMLYAEDEPHAPEIELTRFGGARCFAPSTSVALSKAMEKFADDLRSDPIDRDHLSDKIRNYYSAERMADGLVRALRNESADLSSDGWPST